VFETLSKERESGSEAIHWVRPHKADCGRHLRKSKLMPRAVVPYKVLAKINDNTVGDLFSNAIS
jgi:hypothetical protein